MALRGVGRLLTLLTLAWFVLVVDGLWIVAKEGERKCFVEEIPKDTVVVATFRTEAASTAQAYVYGGQVERKAGFVASVRDSQGNVVLEKALGTQGRVAFTSEEEGEYVICLHSNTTRWLGGGRKFYVHVKIDVADDTVDYDQVAKAYSFNNVEVSAYQLSQKCNDVQKMQQYLKNREYALRNTNESTNARVMWFAFFKIAVLVSSAVSQILYLRRFFKSKKLV